MLVPVKFTDANLQRKIAVSASPDSDATHFRQCRQIYLVRLMESDDAAA